MSEDEVLEIFKRTGALLRGHFELRSGLHSERFFQCANVLRYPRIAARLCEALVRTASDWLPDSIDGVIAPAMGGILVGHEVARILDTPCIFAEKRNGALELRRFTVHPGERWLVAEDVVTRGGRVRETIDLVREAGGTAIGAVFLVDRGAGATSFDVPTASLVRMRPETWKKEECPLCRQEIPIEHPGS